MKRELTFIIVSIVLVCNGIRISSKKEDNRQLYENDLEECGLEQFIRRGNLSELIRQIIFKDIKPFTLSEYEQFNQYYEITIEKVITGNTLLGNKIGNNDTLLEIHLKKIECPNVDPEDGIRSRKFLKGLLKQYKNYNLRLFVKRDDGDSKNLKANVFLGNYHVNGEIIFDISSWCKGENKCPEFCRYLVKDAHVKSPGIWRPIMTYRTNSWHRNKKLDKTKIRANGKYRIAITKVVDGDTLHAVIKGSGDNRIIKVRMSGIDSPEMKQAFGMEARNHLMGLISDVDKNDLTLDIQGSDIYGRSLGLVKRGTIDINKKMIADGFAWCYRNTKCPDSYIDVGDEARLNQKGLFIDADPLPPWEWRKMNKNTKKTISKNKYL